MLQFDFCVLKDIGPLSGWSCCMTFQFGHSVRLSSSTLQISKTITYWPVTCYALRHIVDQRENINTLLWPQVAVGYFLYDHCLPSLFLIQIQYSNSKFNVQIQILFNIQIQIGLNSQFYFKINIQIQYSNSTFSAQIQIQI